MKFTELIQILYKASEFKTPNSLARASGQTRPFTFRLLQGTKTMHKIDSIFEALSPDITAAELISAIEFLRKIKKNGNQENIPHEPNYV